VTRDEIATAMLVGMVSTGGTKEQKVRAAVEYADLLIAQLRATEPSESGGTRRRSAAPGRLSGARDDDTDASVSWSPEVEELAT
jgi:hypothetical protein